MFGLSIFLNKNCWVNWNVTIDGKWEEGETWSCAYNHHTDYITPNSTREHPRDYTHFYIHNDNDYLYIMIDLCSDTTKEDDKDWFVFGLWSQSLEDLDSEGYINESHINKEWKIQGFNKTEESDCGYNINFETRGWLVSDENYNLTIAGKKEYKCKNEDDWKIWIKEGFQSTENSDIKHRIYEIKIKLSSISFERDEEIKTLDDRYYITFAGYGTLSSFDMDQWFSPSFYFEKPATYFECAKVGTNMTSDSDTEYDEATPIFPEIPNYPPSEPL